MKTYSIYKIQNLTNGKCYIGFTGQRANRRMVIHKIGISQCGSICGAIQKYGVNHFSFEVIYQSRDITHALEMESHFIREYNSYGNGGYNQTRGGEGTDGYIRSPEQIERIRNRMLGNSPSLETRRKMSESQKARPRGKDHPLYGRKSSQETIDKIRAVHVGAKRSEETRRKMSEAQRGERGSGFGKTGEKNKTSKQYRVYRKDGEIIEFKGLAAFCREHGYTTSVLSEMVNGKSDKPYRDILKIEYSQ